MAMTTTILFEVRPCFDHGVWRVIEASGQNTLNDLHWGIQDAFHLDNDHLYAFFLNNRPWDKHFEYGGPNANAPHVASRTPLNSLPLCLNKRFLYIFDFGNELRFTVKVTGKGESKEGVHYPILVDGEGQSPPQYPYFDEDHESEGDHDEDGEVGHGQCIESPVHDSALSKLAAPIKGYLRAYDSRHFAYYEVEDSEERSLSSEHAVALDLIEHSGGDVARIHHEVEQTLNDSVWRWLSALPLELSLAGTQEDAVELADKVAELCSSEMLTFDRPLLFARAERKEEAQHHLESNLVEYPDETKMLSRAGEALQALGDIDRAEDCYRKALKWAGDAIEQRAAIADLLLELLHSTGRMDAARDVERSEEQFRVESRRQRFQSFGLGPTGTGETSTTTAMSRPSAHPISKPARAKAKRKKKMARASRRKNHR